MPLISSGYILYRLTAAAAAADKDASEKRQKTSKKPKKKRIKSKKQSNAQKLLRLNWMKIVEIFKHKTTATGTYPLSSPAFAHNSKSPSVFSRILLA